MDIVFPNGNENEMVDMAKRLGTRSLLMLYPADKRGETAPGISVGTICAASDVEKAMSKGGIVAMKSSDNDRAVFESKNAPRLLIGVGENPVPDRMHQRETGLNQPLLRELKKNDVIVVLSLKSLLEREGVARSELIGRWMATIVLCRRAGVKMAIVSGATTPWGMRAQAELESVGVVLGMHPEEARKAVESSI